MKQKRLIIEPLPFHRRMSGVGGNRTSDTRIFSPSSPFVSPCAEMVYACQIKTYDADRSATEA